MEFAKSKERLIHNDVVLREFWKYRYILNEKWHNPSVVIRIISWVNKIILIMVLIISSFYIWNFPILGKYIFYSFFLVFNPIIVIVLANLYSELVRNIKGNSISKEVSNKTIRVEYEIYSKYFSEVRFKPVIPIIFLAAVKFICLMVICVREQKWGRLFSNEYFRLWELDYNGSIFHYIALMGLILVYINLLYFRTMHFKLSVELWRQLYSNDKI
jgi:hypothetical protein